MKVNTVLGEIDLNNLGKTLAHEHMRIRSDEVFNQFPHIFNESEELEKAIDHVNRVKKFDVETICDPTVLGLGRDINFLREIASTTNINILPATGIYTYDEIPIHFRNQSIDYLAKILQQDIEEGIQNTNIKAAFLKCSADSKGITKDINKVIRAVARTSIKTGKPIMAHSKPSNYSGLDIAKLLIEEGVHPQNIQISHTGDTDQLDYIRKLLNLGVFIGMDRYGLEKHASTRKRNSTLIQLIKEGYANQIYISQDYCCNTDWYTEEVKKKQSPKWTMDYIFTDIFPILKKEGVTQEQIDIMLYENIKKWFNPGG